MFGFNKNVCQDVKKQNDQNKISYNFRRIICIQPPYC